jgi:hypothetical protein
VSDWTALLVLSPLILIISGAVIVIVVALFRATPADIPTVMDTAGSILCRLADRLPYVAHRRGGLDIPRQQATADDVTVEEVEQ